MVIIIRIAGFFELGNAIESGLRKLGNNDNFVKEALTVELDMASDDTETDSDKSDYDPVLVLRAAAFSAVDGNIVISGSDAEQEQTTASTTDGTTGVPTPSTTAGEVTLTASTGEGGIAFSNKSSKSVDLASLADGELEIDMSLEGPKVLIYHTHGSEAYTPEGDDVYVASDNSRTEDTDYNMIRVGREIKQVLEQNGIECIQATELHDYPSYTGSYGRSLETVEYYLQKYPSIQVVLDVHRDALENEDGSALKTVANLDQESTAQLLIVVGSDGGGLEHPNWQENLSMGILLQKAIEAQYPTLARPLCLRDSRFNQHLSAQSLLIEIGCNGNTLQEALRCSRLFAQVLSELILEA